MLPPMLPLILLNNIEIIGKLGILFDNFLWPLFFGHGTRFPKSPLEGSLPISIFGLRRLGRVAHLRVTSMKLLSRR